MIKSKAEITEFLIFREDDKKKNVEKQIVQHP